MSHKKEKLYIKDIPAFVESVHNKEDLEKGFTFGSNKKIDFDCPKCGNVYNSFIFGFSKGKRCPACCKYPQVVTEKNCAWNNNDMRLYAKYPESLYLVTPNSHKIGKWKCIDPNCGYEFESTYTNFNNGRRCPACCHNPQVVTEINCAWNNNDMRLYAKYPEKLKLFALNSNKKNLWKCIDPNCGYEFESTYNTFNKGSRCPKCKSSKGEKSIIKILDSLQIEHKSQYRIPECRNKNPLPFDHSIFKDNILIGLIEMQGRQHYKAIEYFGGEKQLLYIQNNDKIKSNYCKQTGIPLLLISYQDNIEQKLTNFLIDLNLISN